MSRIGRPIVILALVAFVAFSAAQSALAGQARAVKDGWLVLKVHSEMVDEDLLSGSDIDVDVKDGVVTLRGTVPTEAGRARALEVARKNDGVKSVVDRLTIAAPRTGEARDRADRAADKAERTGERAAEKAERAGERAADKAERAGERAADKAERAGDRAADKAERRGERAADGSASAARKTGRAIDDGWIKSKIYAQYLADWDTILDDSDIDIDVVNNVVTLSGTVKSAEAKTRAVATAKATDGVKSVRDSLKVVPR
jgi:hyperosmotically inducible protein